MSKSFLNSNLPDVFCDFDGVLVDFEAGFHRNFGILHSSVTEEEMWQHILNHNTHWDDLPRMPDAHELWDAIAHRKPKILTGCPRTGFDHADRGKRTWGHRELGPEVEIITCRTRDKPLHMTHKGAILIDDMIKNCKRWQEAGGVAVHHISASETIARLHALKAI